MIPSGGRMPKPLRSLHMALTTHILTLLLIIQYQTVIDAKHLPNGQCPLRVPTDLSSTSPIDMGRNNEKRPPLLAIGHRGTSFNIPEHTLEGFRLALELRADYLEMDLVPTKDAVLVAVHDINLNRTTDVAAKFPDRFRDMIVKGTAAGDGDEQATISGYFVQDFTLEEVKTLRVKQGFEDTGVRSRLFDWYFSVPTFGEIIDLLHKWNTDIKPLITEGGDHKIGNRPGLYVELKKPRQILEDSGMVMADLFLNELKAHPHGSHLFFGVPHGANKSTNATDFGCAKTGRYQVPPLVVQCFESAVLESLRTSFLNDGGENFNNAEPPLVYLFNEKRCREPEFWYNIRDLQISGIGPEKSCLLEGTEGGGKQFMISAKERNLAVHPWTERLEKEFFDTALYDSAEDELRYMYCELNIHGIFAENVDMAVRVGLRGCDDFRKPIELIKEEIKKEEENGDPEDKKKICPQTEEYDTANIGLACALVGIFAGAMVSFWMTSRHYERKGAPVINSSASYDNDNLSL